jgi:NTE family protein
MSSAVPSPPSRVGLVLAGGSARGAYEVGVVRYILEEISRELGRPVPLDVLSGTSAGSINAVMLAAHADKPIERGAMLARQWTGLQLEDIVRPSPGQIFRLFTRLAGSAERPGGRGGIFDPAGIERVVRDAVPFGAIGKHMATGRLHALSISTTHVPSGRTVVFAQRCEGDPPMLAGDPTVVSRPAVIQQEHVLASAAVPVLFPAVRIDGHFYCDGGLRQNVPLSPARRLGADRLIVINPKYVREVTPTPAAAEAREQDFPDPFFLLGKTMNALLLDRIENDIDRLQRLNGVLEAGTRRFGPDFVPTLNRELVRMGKSGLRQLDVVYVRSSQDIGVMAAEYVRSPAFARRAKGFIGKMLRRIADGEREADLLSYVLFDGPFAGQLVETGWADAQARHAELAAFFAKRLEQG